MAVVAPHLCGMGGDLFALVHVNGQVHALDAAGRAGFGSSAEQLRSEGHPEMPFHDVHRTIVADKSTSYTVAQAITAALLARER